MVKVIKEFDPDLANAPAGSKIIQTQESNLDIIEITSTNQLDLPILEEFEYRDANDNLLFAGATRDHDDGRITTKFGFDFGIELGEIPVRKNYENQTPIQIMEDVINNFTRLTFQNDGVTTNLTIPLYSTQGKRANEVLDDMLALLGATAYVDNTKVYHIEFEGSELNTIVLKVGKNCDISDKGWQRNSDNLAKSVTVNGDLFQTTETIFLSGTGSQTEFEIANPYIDITVEFPIGTELQPKLEGVRDGDYEIFKETKKIVFNTPPASGTDNIKVVYTYELQANFNIGSTQNSVDNGENPHHRTINRKYLKDVLSCREYATKYKEKFQNPLRSATLLYNQSLNSNLFRPNQRIQVIDNQVGIDGQAVNDTFIIKNVERLFGNTGSSLALVVGDSRQLIFDRQAEIEQRIDDFNETNPTAEIFNEGIENLADLELEIEYEFDVEVLTATLPNNILVYDANRTYTNESDINNPSVDKFVYINEDDYIALFDSTTRFVRVTQSGDTRITQSGDTRILDD